MTWYRINGAMVHMKGSKLPAPCRAIVKIREDARKEYCAAPSGFACDWPGCDLPLCRVHRVPVGENKDYCPAHFDAAEHPQPGLFTGLMR